jgi:hypothetical protein
LLNIKCFGKSIQFVSLLFFSMQFVKNKVDFLDYIIFLIENLKQLYILSYSKNLHENQVLLRNCSEVYWKFHHKYVNVYIDLAFLRGVKKHTAYGGYISHKSPTSIFTDTIFVGTYIYFQILLIFFTFSFGFWDIIYFQCLVLLI